MKLTDWIPGDIKPVRKGVYQRQAWSDDVSWGYWNGRYWGLCSKTAERAYWERNESGLQRLSWRGLAEKP